MNRWLCLLFLSLCACGAERKDLKDKDDWPVSFGFGRPATKEEIDSIDFDIRPDGVGLPAGSGTALEGRLVYNNKCSRCHGPGGVGGPYGSLASDFSADTAKEGSRNGREERTIGNYWPWATTVYDYIHRAMPYDSSGSLTDKEVYSLTAYILYANRLIDSATVIDASTLPRIKMPAQELFVVDDRTDGPVIR